jgi:hypothetical protein
VEVLIQIFTLVALSGGHFLVPLLDVCVKWRTVVADIFNLHASIAFRFDDSEHLPLVTFESFRSRSIDGLNAIIDLHYLANPMVLRVVKHLRLMEDGQALRRLAQRGFTLPRTMQTLTLTHYCNWTDCSNWPCSKGLPVDFDHHFPVLRHISVTGTMWPFSSTSLTRISINSTSIPDIYHVLRQCPNLKVAILWQVSDGPEPFHMPPIVLHAIEEIVIGWATLEFMEFLRMPNLKNMQLMHRQSDDHLTLGNLRETLCGTRDKLRSLRLSGLKLDERAFVIEYPFALLDYVIQYPDW